MEKARKVCAYQSHRHTDDDRRHVTLTRERHHPPPHFPEGMPILKIVRIQGLPRDKEPQKPASSVLSNLKTFEA